MNIAWFVYDNDVYDNDVYDNNMLCEFMSLEPSMSCKMYERLCNLYWN